MNVIVSKELTAANVMQLQALSKSTFTETFSSSNSESNLNAYLNNAFNLERLTAELNNIHSKFYFALIDNLPIGYLKLNFAEAQTELQDHTSLEIERIYVLKEFHGAKVGQLLFSKAVEMAKACDLKYIWLGVWEKNTQALKFYTKNGFVQFDQHIFKMGDEDQTDYMMQLIL
jgi:ribosomal protein S18 acetylase RimI-like enzyme